MSHRSLTTADRLPEVGDVIDIDSLPVVYVSRADGGPIMIEDTTPAPPRKPAFTKGPWKWRHDQLNENAAARANKPVVKLPKHALWLLCLCGPPQHPNPDAQSHIDASYWQGIFRVRWSQIVGRTFTGGPTPADRALIAASPTLYTALDKLLAQLPTPDPETPLSKAIQEANDALDLALDIDRTHG